MRILIRECKSCGSEYQHMASAYGMSPDVWNTKRGVSRDYCSKCINKVIPRFKTRLKWWIASVKRLFKKKDKNVIKSVLYDVGPVTPEPMKMPVGHIFNWDYKFGDSKYRESPEDKTEEEDD